MDEEIFSFIKDLESEFGEVSKPKKRKKPTKSSHQKIVQSEFQYFKKKYYSLKDDWAKEEWVREYLDYIEQNYEPEVVTKLKKKISDLIKKDKLFQRVAKKASFKRKIKHTIKRVSRELLENPRMPI